MHKAILAAAVLLAAPGAAQAEWSTDDLSDDIGQLLLAYSADTGDVVEFQVVCDVALEHKLQMLVFTGEELARKKALGAVLPVSIRLDGAAMGPFDARAIAGDGELYLRLDEDEAGSLHHLAQSIAKASDMELSYADSEWRFEMSGAKTALAWLLGTCAF